MRLLAFTLLAIAVAAGIQRALVALLPSNLGGIDNVLLFLLPMLATAGLAYAMRVSSIIYVFFLAILSPFVSWILTILIAVYVLGQPAHRWVI